MKMGDISEEYLIGLANLAFVELEKSVARIKACNDRSTLLLTERLPSRWVVLVEILRAVQAMRSMTQLSADELEPFHVCQLIAGIRSLGRYEELGSECMEMFEEALTLHANEDKSPVDEKVLPTIEGSYGEAFSQLMQNLGSEVPLTVRTLNEATVKTLNMVHDSLLSMQQLVQQIFVEGQTLLEPYHVNEENLSVAIMVGYRKYVKQNHRRIEKLLRQQIGPFRPHRTSPLTPEAWEALSNAEDAAVDAAIRGLAPESEEFAFLGGNEKADMLENRALLECIRQNSNDEELFNFKECIEDHGLLHCLTEKNLFVFYERVHRHNIIQIGMFPQLKNDYDDFLRRKASVENAEGEPEESRWLRRLLSPADVYLTEGHTADWLTETVSRAFASEHRSMLTADLSKRGREKVACMILGRLAEGGVYQAKTDSVLAKALGVDSLQPETVARYINFGRHNDEKLSYIDWFGEQCR